jgi:hypothetical protein
VDFETPELEPEEQTVRHLHINDLFKRIGKPLSFGWDSSQMLWGEAGWDLLLEMNAEKDNKSPRENNSEILFDVQIAIRIVVRSLRETLDRNSQRLIEAGNLEDFAFGKHFPWLSGPSRHYIVNDFPREEVSVFDYDKPLAGQSSGPIDIIAGTILAPPGLIIIPKGVEFNINEFDRNDLGTPLVVVKITSISFHEGSLWTWIDGKILVLGLAATLIVGAVPPAVDAAKHYWTIHEWNQSVQKAEETEPAYKYRGFRFSNEELERLGEKAFNYNEHGISADERRHRIDLTQLALKMILKVEICMDGQAGNDTNQALKELGRRHNTLGTIDNPFLRAELLKGLTAPK